MPEIHQEITFPANPQRIYDILMGSASHAAFTGGPADISPDAGGAFTCHGGKIEGRNIELVPGKRIVQAWRVADWPPGLYSMVRFELQPKGDETTLVLDHTGAPEDARPHLDAGWHKMYWEPLRAYL